MLRWQVVLAVLIFTGSGESIGAQAVPSAETQAGLVLARELPGSPIEDDSVDIRLEPVAYSKLWHVGRAQVQDFPLPGGQKVDLRLQPFDVIAPNAVFVNVDKHGEQIRPRPEIRFVRGGVAGDVDSLVVLSLFQNRISGFIRTRDEEYAVGPGDFSLSGPGATQMQVWKRSREEGHWDCAVTPESSALAASVARREIDPDADLSAQQRDHLGGAQLRLEMAVDSTTEWCANFGNDSVAAQNYLLTTIAQISAIYDNEVLEIIEVPYLRTFCGAADPYTDGLGLGDRSQLLSELESEWIANQTGVSRTITHLFSKSDSGAAGGLANTVTCGGTCQSVLCSETNGYAVNLFPATGGSPASFEISVAAHELGHNHSSPHTNCLQDTGGNWLSTCALETCGINPWCQANGCYPGPQDTNFTGTLMSTGCNSRVAEFDNNVVESILRTSAEAATCIGAAGLPAESQGLELSPVQSCPTQSLQADDGSLNSGLGGPSTWVKRFTPACTPFQLNRVDVIIPSFGASVGQAIRIMIYADPSGSGDPANASLVYTEDTTVQVVSFSTFNQFTLATPVILPAGDLYLGFFDIVDDGSALIALDSSSSGDSYSGFTTDPSGFTLDSSFTYMIRGLGGAVPAGSLLLDWDLPCNDATTPGQDYAVYRGDIGVPGIYDTLTCTTGRNRSYLAVAPPDDSFFLVVPHTNPSEGSYGKTSSGIERPAAALACKPQDLEQCL